MRFRVTSARPCTIAVAAMRLFLIGMVFPVLRRRASSSAHCQPVSPSQGRQQRCPAPASNQRSSARRFFPLGRIRIPPHQDARRRTPAWALSDPVASAGWDEMVAFMKVRYRLTYFLSIEPCELGVHLATCIPCSGPKHLLLVSMGSTRG